MPDTQTTSPFIDHTLDAEAADRKLIEQAQNSAPIGLTTEDVDKAINDVFDIQERSLLHFIWLGDMAKIFKDKAQTQVLHEIELALPSKAVTSEVANLFETWKFTKTDYGYTYEFSVPLKWTTRIPVRIYVYKEKFKLFDNPDSMWAGVDYAYIPNPFEPYWKMRGMIKEKLLNGKPLSKEPF